jgi:type IV pilus assembly protein PilC
MPDYICKIVSAQGTILKRTITADSMEALPALLEEQNEELISAKKMSGTQDLGKYFERFQKVTPKEMSIFTNQMKVMFRAGIPLVRSLEILEQQATSNKFKNVIKDLIKYINAGESLSASMARHPTVFNNLFVNMIRAGEAAGATDEILKQLQEFTEIDISTKKSIKKAVRYPIIVMGVLLMGGGFAIAKIIPTFANMITARGGELPFLTKMLMGISDVMQSYGLLIAGGFIGAFLGIKYYIKTEKGAYQWDHLKLKLPIVKNVLVVLAMSRFSMILKTLVNSGVPITDALEIAKDTIGNRVYANIINTARDKIIEGQPIHVALKHDYIPDVIVNMVQVGEESGALNEMLTSVGVYYSAELDEKLDGLTSAIEPVTTLLIGIFVAGFVAAIFLPMFQMYSL